MGSVGPKGWWGARYDLKFSFIPSTQRANLYHSAGFLLVPFKGRRAALPFPAQVPPPFTPRVGKESGAGRGGPSGGAGSC